MKFNPTGPDPAAEQRLPAELRYRPRPSGQHGILTTGLFGKADVTYVTSHLEIAPGANLVFTRSEQVGYFNAYPTPRK